MTTEGADTSGLLFDEASVAQLGNGLLELRLGVHHNRAVPRDRLLDRLGAAQPHPGALDRKQD